MAGPGTVLLTMLGEAQRRRDARDDAGAAEVLITAVAHAAQTCGAGSLAVAQLRTVLGVALKAIGSYDRAREEYLAALASLRTLGGDADAIATLFHHLADVDLARGDATMAAEWGRRGLAIRRSLHGDDDPRVRADRGNLAPILIALGEYAEAGALLTRLHAEYVERFGPEHYQVAVTLTSLGGLAAHRGQWPEARRHLREAVRIKRAVLGRDHPELLRTLVDLAIATDHDLVLSHSTTWS